MRLRGLREKLFIRLAKWLALAEEPSRMVIKLKFKQRETSLAINLKNVPCRPESRKTIRELPCARQGKHCVNFQYKTRT